MRVFLLLSLAAAASAFGVSRPTISTTTTRSTSTSVYGMPEERTQVSLDNEAKANRWKEIRLLSDEEAEAQLSGEELEAFQTYHGEIKDDIQKMTEIATMMLKSLEPPRVKAKGKKQRKRDAWAKKSAIAEVRAKAAAKAAV
mmetsp:Transcript_14136/g.17865  ORF Transcript_14136/g.17865 Transcript_14136/m.17865 type:complete len:142 (+) Transcript_14136:88-513(+)